jgi:hypothetical protein
MMTHLREVLGDETYESLANAGGNMTTAAMAACDRDPLPGGLPTLVGGSAVSMSPCRLMGLSASVEGRRSCCVME